MLHGGFPPQSREMEPLNDCEWLVDAPGGARGCSAVVLNLARLRLRCGGGLVVKAPRFKPGVKLVTLTHSTGVDAMCHIGQ